MNLSIGIIGLPNVGKSTLFNALLKRQAALAANYPFATIEPNVGVVDVPDVRLKKLAELVKNEYGQRQDKEVPERIMPAVIKFYDIAGLVKGASNGEGLGNQFLSHIREVDVLMQVVRDFNDDNVIRAGSTDPKSDIEIINMELILADIQSLEKQVSRLESELKKTKSSDAQTKYSLAMEILSVLNKNQLATQAINKLEDYELAKDLNLLTLKPMMYIMNVSVESKKDVNSTQAFDKDPINGIYIDAQLESELSSFTEIEKQEYLQQVGIMESGLDKVIKKGFDLLGLQTYLTAGPKEVRAWTIKKGTKAPQAAGAIHTDFEKGFISAEVISCDDLLSVGGWKLAKDKGMLRIEGKSYVMQDGDVVEFRINL